jgi:selT/selW/selH-like putative selenoprotein
LAAAIQKTTGVKPELIRSSGGAFEVKKGGLLLFSKLKEDRFPEHDEILKLLR